MMRARIGRRGALDTPRVLQEAASPSTRCCQGPEAHELCVYFGRLRGGELSELFAGLGLGVPGFVLMLALSMVYVKAEPGGATWTRSSTERTAAVAGTGGAERWFDREAWFRRRTSRSPILAPGGLRPDARLGAPASCCWRGSRVRAVGRTAAAGFRARTPSPPLSAGVVVVAGAMHPAADRAASSKGLKAGLLTLAAPTP